MNFIFCLNSQSHIEQLKTNCNKMHFDNAYKKKGKKKEKKLSIHIIACLYFFKLYKTLLVLVMLPSKMHSEVHSLIIEIVEA